jgi:hypothetical protein
MLYFYDDLYAIGDPDLTNVLTDTLFTYAILPAIFGSFTMSKKGALSINLGVVLLFQIYEKISNQQVLDILSVCILKVQYPSE